MANAAAVFAAVKAVVTAVVTAYKAHWIVRAVVAVVATIAAGQIAKAFAKKPEKGQSTTIDQGLELALKLNPVQPRSIPVGTVATGGSLVWAFTSDDELGDVENERLTRIISLSDVPIEGLLAVRDGDTELEWEGDWNTGFASCVQYRQDGAPCLFLQMVNGSYEGAPFPWLVERSGGKWTNEHIGVGQAYCVLSMIYRPDVFPNGEPSLVFVVKGAKIYDDRKDGSKPERTGSHRLADPTTWEFTENTANITAQLLRGFYVNGQLLLGAQAEERDVSDYNLIAAYNTCDQDADTLNEGMQPRYRAGTMMYSDQTVSELLGDLMGAMDGTIYDSGGQINLRPGATHEPVMDLTDDDIVWTDEKSYQPKASIDALYNAVTGSHVGGDAGFIEKSLPPLVNADWEAEDGGERLVKEITLKAVIYDSQAQRTATRVHKASRWQAIAAFVMPLWGWELEQGDWFTLTSTRWDMDEKYFEVLECTLTPDFRISIIAKEVHPDIDGWDPAEEEVDDGSDPDTPTVPGLLTPLLDVDPILLSNEDSTVQIPALKVQVLNIVPQGRATGVDFEFTEFDGEEPTLPAQSLGRRPPDQLTFNIDSGVMPGRKYGVRARSTDGIGYSLWSSWYTATASSTYTVPGTIDPGLIDPDIVMGWLEDIDAAGLDLRDRFIALIATMWERIDFTAESIFNLAFAHTENKQYQDALLYIQSQPVGTVVLSEQIRTDDLVIDRDLLGHRSEDGYSFILDVDTVLFDEETGESVADRFTVITSSIDDNTATIASNYTTLASADTAIATSVTSLTATVTNNNNTLTAAIVSESSARSSGDTAVASTVTALAASTNTSISSINTTLTAQASTNSSVASSITTLTSTTAANAAAITTEATARTTQDSAFSALFTLLGATVGGGSAFALSGTTVQVGGGVSLASYISGVTTALNANSAAIATEATTRSTNDSAIATTVSTLSTTVGGHTASITTLNTSVDGVEARWGIALNVDGYISGIVQNSSSTVSELYVAADIFGLIDPSGDGDPVIPFSVVNGIAAFNAPISIGAGTSMMVLGAPAFGTFDNLILWFGPSSISRADMTPANAIFYIDNTGKMKIRDAVITGDRVNIARATALTDYQYVTIGPYGSGTENKTITAIFSLVASGFAPFTGSTGSAPGYIEVGDLAIHQGGVGGTVVSDNPSRITGTMNSYYDSDAGGRFWEFSAVGTINYTDSDSGTHDRTYTAEVDITENGSDFLMMVLPSGHGDIGVYWSAALDLVIRSVELE